MIKRIIFDVDDTLIPWKRKYLFKLRSILKKQKINIPLLSLVKISHLIDEYEVEFEKYDKEFLKSFLADKSKIDITDELLNCLFFWIEQCIPKNKNKEIEKTLKYLQKKYDLVVLTNFFQAVQVKRLENYGILKYFSVIIGGDDNIKPNPEAYKLACGEFLPAECLMVGDNYQKDYEMPSKLGLKAIWLTKKRKGKNIIDKIERLREIL